MSYFDNGGIIGKTVTVKSPVPASTYDTAIDNVSGGSPDFRWTLNNTTAEEGAHTTTVNGTWSYINGLIPSNSDNSANLDGSTTYLVPANDPLINAGTGYSFRKRSVSFWFNADTIGTYPCIWEQGGGVNWFSIYLNSGLIYVNIGENSSTGGHATASVSTGTTYHCLVTVDLSLGSNNLKIYLNGSLAGQASSSIGTSLIEHTGDVRLGFGSSRNHLNTSNPYSIFDGKLQDLCYWSEVALTATDAENIYNAGITTDTYNSGAWSLDAVYDYNRQVSIIESNLVLNLDAGQNDSYPGTGTTWFDLSDSGINGTLVNGVGYSSSNLGTLTFNGSNQYVNCGSNSILNISDNYYTICAWVRTTFTSNWQWVYQFGEHASGKDRSLVIRSDGYATNYTYGSDVPSTTDVRTGDWFYICATTTPTTKKIYVNGVLENTGSWTPVAYSYPGVLIGILNVSSIYDFNGDISVIHVYNRTLTDSEIRQNFESLRGRYNV